MLSKGWRKNRQIESYLKQDHKRCHRELKLLLLGSESSGKSLFIKQLKIIHGGYTVDELRGFTRAVFQDMFEAIKCLCKEMGSLKIEYHDSKNKENAENLFRIDPARFTSFDEQTKDAIVSLWKDKGIQQAFDRRREFELLDSAVYFLNDSQRIMHNDYIPNLQDVLRVRVQTCGIVEHKFIIDNMTLSITDVAGQKGKPRKWMQCFECVTLIIFIVDISEYDEILLENDGQMNALEESRNDFKTLLCYPWFQKTSVLLFFNNIDVFEEKIKVSDLSNYFPDFNGATKNAKAAREFVLRMFVDVNSNAERKIYSHFICPTDTESMRFIFAAVKDAILYRCELEYYKT